MAMGLVHNLEAEGHSVEHTADGGQGLARALAGGHDLVILDLMLPGRSGFEVLERMRAVDPETPVLILSARSTEMDKVHGFRLGADDYLTKPFGLGELLARVAARLRRHPAGASGVARLGDATVDLGRSCVERDGQRHDLTPFERALLRYFLENPGRVIERTELLNKVWGYQRFPTTRTVDNHVARLRKKLERDPSAPAHLKTVHGLGYRLGP
ncbi:MAG: response regulator transcription factor [Planctomycetes bacterium]|nr:response regulator transcription factor [Planctomycetota bacterium]